MKKYFIFIFLIISGAVKAGDCLIFSGNGPRMAVSCEVDLDGGGANWLSQKITIDTKTYYTYVGGCDEASNGQKTCSDVQLTDKEGGLYEGEPELAVRYALDNHLKKTTNFSEAPWECFKQKNGSINLCYKQ